MSSDDQNVIFRQPQGILRRVLPVGRGARRSGLTSNIPNLTVLAMNSFLRYIERELESPLLRNAVMSPLKTHFKDLIPPILRQKMMNAVLSSGRIYNSVDINLFGFFMDSQIRHVCVRHVRKWYREVFLQVLKEHGCGLHTLYLEEINVAPDCGINLAQTLMTMHNLTCVSLRFVCDDACLWSLGRNCPVLEELDVEGSTQVTDLGVQTLCLRGATLPSAQYQPRVENIVTSEQTCIGALCSCLQWLCASDTFAAENSVIGVSWWRASLMKRARKNPCCSTLQLINLRATSVTTNKSSVLIESCCPLAKILISQQSL